MKDLQRICYELLLFQFQLHDNDRSFNDEFQESLQRILSIFTNIQISISEFVIKIFSTIILNTTMKPGLWMLLMERSGRQIFSIF